MAPDFKRYLAPAARLILSAFWQARLAGSCMPQWQGMRHVENTLAQWTGDINSIEALHQAPCTNEKTATRSVFVVS